MHLRLAKDPTLLNLFVPEIEPEISTLSSNNDVVEEFNFKTIDSFTSYLEDSDTKNSQTTALVVQKQYAILDPTVVYRFKKSIKLSIRSFLISLSLTFLNFFI